MPKLPFNYRKNRPLRRIRLSHSRPFPPPIERSPDWGKYRHCRGKVTGPCNQGYPFVQSRVRNEDRKSLPIKFQIIVWDGEKLVRHVAMVSTTSTTDGKPDWYTDDGRVITCIAYTKVAAWASLGA